jgi:hypothetical protein
VERANNHGGDENTKSLQEFVGKQLQNLESQKIQASQNLESQRLQAFRNDSFKDKKHISLARKYKLPAR